MKSGQLAILWIGLSACGPIAPAADAAKTPFHAVQCEGEYAKHLQGVCTDDKQALFWCFTDMLVKTDADGRVLKKIPVAWHHGDLCYCDGKVYVAVNLGKFNQASKTSADSWVYVYTAELQEVARHKVPELVYGAGGMGVRNGRFVVIGGLPIGASENYAYEYDAEFHFVGRHVIRSGYTLMGIQTATWCGNSWWFGCYGKPKVLLKTDGEFKFQGRYNLDCSYGIVGLSDGSLLVARDATRPNKKHIAKLVLADPDEQRGLVIRPGQE